MKTKVVYAVVSSADDFFIEQLQLSICSLRIHNKNAVVELVIDKETCDGLQGNRSFVKDMADSVHVVQCPTDYTQREKSRYLKTNIRRIVKGTFLYLDCDTLVCDSLEEIDKCDYELAMVADLNDHLLLYENNTIRKYAEAGFGDATGVPYYNSGVIYSKDTSGTQDFFNTWYKYLIKSFDCGVMYDQPALCATNEKKNRIIKELSGEWNCQYKMKGMKFLDHAKIMHYYSDNGNDCLQKSMMGFFLNYVRYNTVSSDNVYGIIRNAKIEFYSLTTITQDQQIRLINSSALWLLSNRPRIFNLIMEIGFFLDRMLYGFRR